MFKKKAEFNIELSDPRFLNIPKLADYVVDQGIKPDKQAYDEIVAKLKLDSESKTAELDVDGDQTTKFDLEAEIQEHPDSLFVKCFAIRADEMNDNGDYFGHNELKKAVGTFVGVPVFTNHQNNDVEQARGKVVHSWWDNDENGIMIIARVDAAAYPQLARGIKEKYVVGSSMGAQVAFSLCSICHNWASDPDKYCSHIKERKTRHVASKKQKCQYHKNGADKECPICGSTKSNIKTYSVDQKAFEYNYGVKFIENSFVVNPAFNNCGVREVIDPQKFLRRVAAIAATLPKLLKVASTQDVMCDNKKCIKLAGQKELDTLNQALEMCIDVSKTMLGQRAQIDLEFVSDLVEVEAKLQETIDELTQQGYGRIEIQPGEEVPGQTPDQPGAKTAPMVPTPGGGSSVQTGTAGQVGTVTGPMAYHKKLDLEKLARDIKHGGKRISIRHPLRSRKSLDLKV